MFRASSSFYQRLAKMGRGLILDLGCGVATPLVFRDGIGCDFSLVALRKLSKRLAGSGFVSADAYRLPFREKTFDTIFCLGVLEHFDDQLAVMSEISRTSREGCNLLLTVTNSWRWTRVLRQLEFIHPSKFYRQPIEKFLSPNEVFKILRETGFSISGYHNPRQFNFEEYFQVNQIFSTLFSKVDKLLPLTLSIEPLYLAIKN